MAPQIVPSQSSLGSATARSSSSRLCHSLKPVRPADGAPAHFRAPARTSAAAQSSGPRHHVLPALTACCRASATACRAAPPAPYEPASAEGDEVCMPPDITTDNAGHDEFSIVTIEVKGYPGMFRVIAWVLTGLMLDVRNATLHTDDDGIVTNRFWLTDMSGNKLSDKQLSSVAERLTDYVAYCTPDESAKHATKFSHGPSTVDNALDEQRSVVTIFAPGRRQERLPRNALLEIASAINGCGLKIHRAEIQSCSDCGVPIENADFPEAAAAGHRLYKFWATDREDRKLDMGRASALLYTMNLLFGSSGTSGATTVPRPII